MHFLCIFHNLYIVFSIYKAVFPFLSNQKPANLHSGTDGSMFFAPFVLLTILQRSVFQSDLICDQCYKFRIRWFSFSGIYGVAEQFIDSIQFAPAPGYFYGMTYRPFHPTGGCLMFLGNGRVKDLCDRIQHLQIID